MSDGFEEALKTQHIRWFNLSFKPAVEKMLAKGAISKYIAEKLLDGAAHLERKRIPAAVIPKALNTSAAMRIPDDEHLLLQGYERKLQQPEVGHEDSSLLPNDSIREPSADSVPTTLQAPERCEVTSDAPRAKLCQHIWSCSCPNGPGLR